MHCREGVSGRPISGVVTLHIVQSILERAKRQRLELPDLEASRGVQWGGEEIAQCLKVKLK